MIGVTENLAIIKDLLASSAVEVDRDPEAVKLLAVSKKQPISKIIDAANAGQRDFGENFVQEGLEKIAQTKDLALVWHFIGHLQNNKTRSVAENFDWVHTVDNPKTARRLSKQRPESLGPLNICLQVNIDKEAGKSGTNASELREFNLFEGTVAKCANCHTVNTPANGSQFTDFNYYNIATPINTSNPAYIADNGFRDIGLGGNTALSAGQQAAEQGKFRTPTLRNVELTAPYMHNGIYATLTEVIRHYDITATDSAPINFTTEVINDIALELNFQLDMPLGLSMQDYADLEAFMLTLTDGFM